MTPVIRNATSFRRTPHVLLFLSALFSFLNASSTLHAQGTGTWLLLPVPPPPSTRYQFIDFADSVNGWVVTSDGHFSITSDGGQVWRGPRSIDSVQVVEKAKLYDAGSGMVISSPSPGPPSAKIPLKISRTSDGGVTWISSFLPDSVPARLPVSLVNRRKIGFVVPDRSMARNVLYTSSDHGVHWDTMAIRIAPLPFVNTLEILESGVMFLGYGGGLTGGLWRSSDSGSTWTEFVPPSMLTSVSARFHTTSLGAFGLSYGDETPDPSTLFYNAATDRTWSCGGRREWFGALYADGSSLAVDAWYGKLWRRPGDSLFVVQTGDAGLRIVGLATVGPRYAWILGDSNRVFRRIDLLTGVRGRKETVNGFVLEQNHPNPFNPSTTIRYGSSRRATISLVIFNALGQQVARLVDGEVDAGYHEVTFDGSGLASGMYICRLQAGAYAEVRVMVLLR